MSLDHKVSSVLEHADAEYEDGNDIEYEPASCMQQTMALIRKNLLNKLRTPAGSILELVSPAIFMLILVLGYSLSEEEFRDVGKYSEWEFDLPDERLTSAVIDAINGGGRNIEGLGDFTNLNSGSRRNLVEQKLSYFDPLYDLDEYEVEGGGNSNSRLFQWQNVHQISRMLQNGNETNGEEEDFDDEVGPGYEEITSSLNGLRKEVSIYFDSLFRNE